MMIETDHGQYSVEFDLESIKKMELAGIRPLKMISEAGDDPMSMSVTDMMGMLDHCARYVSSEPWDAPMPFSFAIEDSGYGLFDIMEMFAEVFAKSPFLTNRRLSASSENASETARNGSPDGI